MPGRIGHWAWRIDHRALTRPVCALAIVCALSACGKKGPPLAPISHIPSAVAQPTIERVGDDIYVSLTVPSKDIDGTLPADVGRIELYGITATAAPSPTQFLAAGTRVATIPVAPPPAKDEAPPATNEPAQGSMVSIRDPLKPDDLVPKELPTAQARVSRGATSTPAASATVDQGEAAAPQRYYMAIAFNRRGRPGPPGMAAGVALTPLPDPPEHLDATYTSETLTLTWQAAVPPDANATLPAALMTRYNVYRTEEDPLAYPSPPPPPWAARRPMPVNASPLDAVMFAEPVEFDRQTCFTVRAVRGVAPTALESNAPPPLCRTPVDTFPPAAPKSLSAVAGEGAISLIWEPNSEPDLGGYVILRGEPGSDTLQPLTATPVAEAQFTDRTVKSGVRYVYAVVAVDNRVPVPNVSAASNRVEETAR